MTSNVFILSATITPPRGAAQLARTDPKIRLNDYVTALAFYIEQVKSGIITGLVFADNSNSDISELQKMAATSGIENKIEFISFYGLDYAPTFGRGYGEFKLVDYVMEHSTIIQSQPATAKIWKVTGRYILRNIREIIDTAPSSFDFYCNCRNIPEHWIDLYVLCWSKNGHNQILRGIYEKLKEGDIKGSAEHEFRRILDKLSTDLKIVKRFRRVPILEGIRGLDNQSYADMRMKLIARRIAARLFPWLWI